MKSKVSWLLAGLIVVMVATGCKSPQNAKTIYGYKTGKTHDEPPSPPMDNVPPMTNTSAISNVEPEPVPLSTTDHNLWKHDESAFAEQTVYFSFDSVTIKNAEKSKALVVAAYLQSNPKEAVLVEGNCDERGTEEYNRALGERRALAAREALLGAGVTPDRIDLISYGEDKPAEVGHNEAAWKKNRRAAFVLLTPP